MPGTLDPTPVTTWHHDSCHDMERVPEMGTSPPSCNMCNDVGLSSEMCERKLNCHKTFGAIGLQLACALAQKTGYRKPSQAKPGMQIVN